VPPVGGEEEEVEEVPHVSLVREVVEEVSRRPREEQREGDEVEAVVSRGGPDEREDDEEGHRPRDREGGREGLAEAEDAPRVRDPHDVEEPRDDVETGALAEGLEVVEDDLLRDEVEGDPDRGEDEEELLPGEAAIRGQAISRSAWRWQATQ